MNLRYFIEMAFFIVNVLVFQLFISKFNADLHLLTIDIDHLVELGVYERDEFGRILAGTFEEEILKGRFTEAEIADIKYTKEHLAYEIELAVFELDEAMFIAMVSFAFPF